MSDPLGLLSVLGSVCCCIAVFLVALAGFSFAFRPRRPRGAELRGMAPPPSRGVQTQASLTRMEEEADRAAARARKEAVATRPSGASSPSASSGRAGGPGASSGPPPVVQSTASPSATSPSTPPPVPPSAPPPGRTAPSLAKGSAAPSLAKGPPPVPPASPASAVPAPPVPPAPAGPPPVPPALSKGPPPIPVGTRLLSPSVTIAPGSGEQAPPPRDPVPPSRKD